MSFKHYSIQNVLRLADYLVDQSPQCYFKPISILVTKLYKHGCLDEAKHICSKFEKQISKHLSEFVFQEIEKHKIEEGLEIEEIKDVFGPVTTSSGATQCL